MAFENLDVTESVTLHFQEKLPTPPFTEFDGTDSIDLRRIISEATRANSIGWPHVKTTNPYHGARQEWHQSIGSRFGTHDDGIGNTYFVSGDFGSLIGLNKNPWADSRCFQPEGDNLRAKMINNLINKISSNQMQLGEAYHTRGDTARLVGDAASKIAKSFLALKRGNLRQAVTTLTGSASNLPVKRYAGQIPEQWLALQYGWKPLLQDCYNGMKTVQKAWSSGGAFKVSTKASMNSGDLVLSLQQNQFCPSIQDTYSGRLVQGSASIAYRMDSPQASALADTGIINPASIAWEILPYSFVVDWFLPIGPYLGNLTYDLGLAFSHGYITIKYDQSCTRRMVNNHVSPAGSGYDLVYFGGSGFGTAVRLDREVLSSFPSVPLPQLKDPLSLGHMANGLSLLINAFKR